MTVRAVSVRDQTVGFEGAIAISGTDESRFNRREALAIRLARALADRPFRLDDDLLMALRTEYQDAEIIEMIFCCAIFSWGNIIGIATRVDTDPDGPYASGLTYAEGHERKMSKPQAGPQ
jgi:alkylhydroperoxidase family enzyme